MERSDLIIINRPCCKVLEHNIKDKPLWQMIEYKETALIELLHTDY